MMCVQNVCTSKGDYLYVHGRSNYTRFFQNRDSQALRIPQNLRTDKKEFFIRKIGDVFIAYPTDDPWAPIRQVIGTFPEDFMSDRNQPSWDDVTSRPSMEDIIVQDAITALDDDNDIEAQENS